MKIPGFALLAGLLLTGCGTGWEEILITKLKDRKNPPDGTVKQELAFGKDAGTVFLADFNGKAVNAVTGDKGIVTRAVYPASLYGKGLRMDSAGVGKYLCRFPTTEPLSMLTGSFEALVRYDGISDGFNHILDKSWLYGLTVYNGKLAVHFGGGLHGWRYFDVAMPVGKWTYVAVTYDGEILNIYLNGKFVSSSPNEDGLGDPSFDLGIGNASDSGFDIPFKGTIDEMRLSNVVRSPIEIAAIWKGIERKINGK